MFKFLSHVLDPDDLAWPGEPVVKVRQCTDVTEECPFCSFITELPNHCGTHMDTPRHFKQGGISINELSMDYFCHKRIAVLDIPKGMAEGVTKEDLKLYKDELEEVTFAFIRTGFEKYRTENPKIYQNEGPYMAPSAGGYLTESFPNLKGIGMDFLSIGSPSTKVPKAELPPDCHRSILGYYTNKFVTGIEDMHLSEIPKDKKILQFFSLPLRVKGLDSSQVVCVAEFED